MAIARLDEDAGKMSVAAVGNVAAAWWDRGGTVRFGSSAFTLGIPRQVLRVRVEDSPITDRGLAAMCTDGLSERSLSALEQGPSVEHPVLVAHRLLEEFGRGDDDALVVVAG